MNAAPLEPHAVRALLLGLGFREETAALLEAEARALPDGFAAFCQTWQADAKTAATDARFSGLQQALAVVNAFPAMVAAHAARELPPAITAATARDLERRLDDYRATHGVPGFDKLAWMRNHTSGVLYEIGRLQYVPGAPFEIPYDVYRSGSRTTAYAREGIHVSDAGWPSFQPAAWQTRQEAGCGHPVDPASGRILRERVKMEGERVLDAGSKVAAIHIPSGGKLTREGCLASLREARAVLERHFPEHRHRAFFTSTWLLDRALEAVLPPESNILAFGRLFSPLPARDATHDQHLERIFGKGVDWQTAPATTSLQRAVAAYLREGGELRVTAGYRLVEEEG